MSDGKTDHERLQEAVREVLYRTVTTGRGGYSSEFGPVVFGKLVRLTGFDINKREVNEIL